MSRISFENVSRRHWDLGNSLNTLALKSRVNLLKMVRKIVLESWLAVGEYHTVRHGHNSRKVGTKLFDILASILRSIFSRME